MNRCYINISKWGIDLRPIIAYGFSVLKMSDKEMSRELCISGERVRQLRVSQGEMQYFLTCSCGRKVRKIGETICSRCVISQRGVRRKDLCTCGRNKLITSIRCRHCNANNRYKERPEERERHKEYYLKLKNNPEKYQEHLKKNRERARLKRAVNYSPFWIKDS